MIWSHMSTGVVHPEGAGSRDWQRLWLAATKSAFPGGGRLFYPPGTLVRRGLPRLAAVVVGSDPIRFSGGRETFVTHREP